jgi:two-component system LytT family sensor kinase
MDKVGKLNSGKIWSVVPSHVLAWGLYIGYELIYVYLITGTIKNPAAYALNYCLNISLFYFNAFFLFRYAVEKFKLSWLIILVLVILEIVVFNIIKYPINVLVLGDQVSLSSPDQIRVYLLSNALRSFYYISFSTAYWLAILNTKRNQKIAELETQRLIQENEKILLQKDLLQSRNAYLQAQVNPHLLFNTLNFMYNASAKVSEKLADAVMTLSDIMRYALTGIDDDDKVLLEKEISHIHNYIQLNQVRYDQKLNINLKLNGEIDGLRIIPLALITLVENVFKYGDLMDPEDAAWIKIEVQNNTLNMDLYNKKRANRRIHSHGTGIKNLRERLETYYPGAYKLEIDDREHTYFLNLSLTLK